MRSDDLCPPTEGFYDTAVNEASESELLLILPMRARVAKHVRCAEVPDVKKAL